MSKIEWLSQATAFMFGSSAEAAQKSGKTGENTRTARTVQVFAEWVFVSGGVALSAIDYEIGFRSFSEEHVL